MDVPPTAVDAGSGPPTDILGRHHHAPHFPRESERKERPDSKDRRHHGHALKMVRGLPGAAARGPRGGPARAPSVFPNVLVGTARRGVLHVRRN